MFLHDKYLELDLVEGQLWDFSEIKVIVNKVFEQLTSHWFDQLTAYRKKNSDETALLSLTENWIQALDEHKFVGMLMSTDMSKALDSLHHPLISF